MKWFYVIASLALVSSSFAIDPPPQTVPDGGTTMLLLAGAGATLACIGSAIKRR